MNSAEARNVPVWLFRESELAAPEAPKSAPAIGDAVVFWLNDRSAGASGRIVFLDGEHALVAVGMLGCFGVPLTRLSFPDRPPAIGTLGPSDRPPLVGRPEPEAGNG